MPAETRDSVAFWAIPLPRVMATPSPDSPVSVSFVVPVPHTQVLWRVTGVMAAVLYSPAALMPRPPLFPLAIVACCTLHDEPHWTAITVLVAAAAVDNPVMFRVQVIEFVPETESCTWQELWSGTSASAVSQPAPL